MGILSLYFLGTTIWQFSHASDSESKELLLGEGRLGKYGLFVGEAGLVGGLSRGETRGRRASLSDVGWS